MSKIEEMKVERGRGSQETEYRGDLECFRVEKSLEDIDGDYDSVQTRRCKALENFSHEQIDEIFNGLVTLRKNLESISESEIFEYNYTEKNSIKILHQGLSFWRYLRRFVGRQKDAPIWRSIQNIRSRTDNQIHRPRNQFCCKPVGMRSCWVMLHLE